MNKDDEDVEGVEEEAECSAPRCKQPVADQICWVQCDHCQEWFHCICVGLTKEYAEKIDSYNCKGCQAMGKVSSNTGNAAGGGKIKTRVTLPPKSKSAADSLLNSPSAAAATHSLMKGLLQNPQLSQLLNSALLK